MKAERNERVILNAKDRSTSCLVAEKFETKHSERLSINYRTVHKMFVSFKEMESVCDRSEIGPRTSSDPERSTPVGKRVAESLCKSIRKLPPETGVSIQDILAINHFSPSS